jgi:hypothetical protein
MGIFHYFDYRQVRKDELGPPIWRHRNSYTLSVSVVIGNIFLRTMPSRDLFACGRIRATTNTKTLPVSQSVNQPTLIMAASKRADCPNPDLYQNAKGNLTLTAQCNTDRHFAFNKILLQLNYVSATLPGTSLKEDAYSAQPDDRYDPEIPKTRPQPQGAAYDSRSS